MYFIGYLFGSTLRNPARSYLVSEQNYCLEECLGETFFLSWVEWNSTVHGKAFRTWWCRLAVLNEVAKGFRGKPLLRWWWGKCVCVLLAVPSRKCESCCHLPELPGLQTPPRSSSLIRDLYQQKLGKVTWSSLQQVRCFLSETRKGLLLLLALTRW